MVKDESAGLKAWLPSTEETNDFYKCNCEDPEKKICYSPYHRDINQSHSPHESDESPEESQPHS